jgi:hypothetical protein
MDRNESEKDARQIVGEPLAELRAHGGTAWTARYLDHDRRLSLGGFELRLHPLVQVGTCLSIGAPQDWLRN